MARRPPASRRRSSGSAALPSPAVLIGVGVVVLLLLVLVVRGCGEDSLSAQELRSQASAICVATAARTDRIAVPNAPAGGTRFLTEGLGELRSSVVGLRRLKAPEELRDDYDAALVLAVQEAKLIVTAVKQMNGGEDVIAGFRALQRQLAPVLARENALWSALEIPACVRR